MRGDEVLTDRTVNREFYNLGTFRGVVTEAADNLDDGDNVWTGVKEIINTLFNSGMKSINSSCCQCMKNIDLTKSNCMCVFIYIEVLRLFVSASKRVRL